MRGTWYATTPAWALPVQAAASTTAGEIATEPPLHWAFALIPLACLAALAAAVRLYAGRVRGRGGRVPRATLGWAGTFAAALAGLAALVVAGLVEGDALTVTLASLVGLGGGLVAVSRRAVLGIFERLDGPDGADRAMGELARAARDLFALVIATTASFCALEFPYNVYGLLTNPLGATYQACVIFAVLLVLYLAAQRRGWLPAVGVALFFLVGVAEYFVIEFKGASIAATDVLFALGTAAAVGDAYTYSVTARVVLGLASALAGMAALVVVAPSRPATARARRANLAGNLAGAGVGALALALVLSQLNLRTTFNLVPDYWNNITQHSANGFLTTFVSEAQNLRIEVPEGYSDEEAERLVGAWADRYDETTGASEARRAAEAQFDEVRPNVVVVMGEAFSDLSVINGLGCGYAGPEFWNGELRAQSVAGGALYTSVLGSGTCNTEFEFLTGESMSFVGDGKLVYPMYDLSGIDTLPRQLSQLGYACTAIHPNYATNWNRDEVYPDMGFGEFVTISDFEGATSFHSGVSDADTFDKCLEVLESGDGPQFVFAVTMQGHSPYTQGNIPEGQLTDYQPQGAGTPGETAELNEYLSCVEATDEDLERFVAELAELDEPTVLVFFGDHQPFLSETYNDAYYADEGEAAHSARVYQTTYRVWANYDVAGAGRGAQAGAGAQDLSAPTLAAQTLSLIGAPLTDYQKATLAYREEIPATYAYGYLGPDGVWYANSDEASPHRDLYRDLNVMHYWHFGARVG